jgi:hypothetical protein
MAVLASDEETYLTGEEEQGERGFVFSWSLIPEFLLIVILFLGLFFLTFIFS